MSRATRVVLLWAVLCSACGGGGNAGGGPSDGGGSGTSGWPAHFAFGADASGGDARGIAIDATGNVYVSGQFYGDSSFIVKFDPAGHVVWNKSYAVADFWGIAADSSNGGALYVAATKLETLNAPLLVKLDLDGNMKWSQALTPTKAPNSPPVNGGGAVAVTVDPSGNPIVAGICDSPIMNVAPAKLGETDLFVAKYDPAGTNTWVTMLGTGTGTSASNLISLAPDAQGNVLLASEGQDAVGGQTFVGGLGDILLAKFDSSGKTTWVREDGTSAEDGAYGVAVDSTGNAYVAGFSMGALDGQSNAGMRDLVLLKYDASGNRLWAREIGSQWQDNGLGVGLDPKGLPIIGGTSEGDFDGHKNSSPSNAGGNPNTVVVKYDATGNKLWSNEYGTEAGDQAQGLVVDKNGYAFVAGGAGSSSPGYVLRFTPDGHVK